MHFIRLETYGKRLDLATKPKTRTQAFGTSKREGHDASPFYNRFEKLDLSIPNGALLSRYPRRVNHIWRGDARDMDACIAADSGGKVLPDEAVALVVTSPPYFSGKEYELTMGADGVPGSYLEYLDMLKSVFKECYRKLEPGGRIAVNVANLGRKPYRSLSADVIGILQDLDFLLRGEIIWVKAETSSGSCAWGSFQRASNPVLRDVTERIIVASKATFARVMNVKARQESELPFLSTMTRDAFLSDTIDVWEFPPESAQRVGHPAPFPIELPRRLINLFTYKGDLVLDPFIGVGTTAVAALETKRNYAGFELVQEYVDVAKRRIEETRQKLQEGPPNVPGMEIQFKPSRGHLQIKDFSEIENFQKRATEQGTMAQKVGEDLLKTCGFEILQRALKMKSIGIEVNIKARSKSGDVFYFDISGAFTGTRPGLKRTDTLWKALGKASILNLPHSEERHPYILLTTDKPQPGSAGDKALRVAVGAGKPIHDVFEMRNTDDCRRLWELGQGDADVE